MSATPPYSVKETKKSLSVITINYNNVQGLRRTIESVVTQTTCDFEYIIIDGGSTDGSVDVIKEYADYIDYWVSEPDKGIYNAMNKGVRVAHGEYCNFLNSGDFFYAKNVVENFVGSNPSADIVLGYIRRVHFIDSEIIYGSLKQPYTEINSEILLTKSIAHQGSFIKTKLLQDNPYDESLRITSDWKFFIEELIIKQRSYAPIDLIVTNYDISGVSAHNDEVVFDERKTILYSLFPRKLVDDFIAKIKGRTPLERMLYFARPDGLFVKILTKVARLLLLFKARNLKLY